ncbi:hypothetical protein [Cribrihabitans pelagius]|uniref:hypothetical protein n=1 Tax=Cribrihabitans pelagius TaxID=1765746 RepID=UPI003B5B0957
MLRNDAEALRKQLRAEEDADSPAVKNQVAKLDPLIRDCQKVEKLLAEQSADFARLQNAGHELDLTAARREIESRLARLRAALPAGQLPE